MEKNIALSVDWLDLFGGAERVVFEMSRVVTFKEVYTLVDNRKDEEKSLFFVSKPKIITSPLQYVKSKFRFAFPIFPIFFSFLQINKEIDIIISSSFNVAKGIKKTTKNQIHIAYIQAENFMYIKNTENLRLFFGKRWFFIYPFVSYLKRWDKISANRPDYYIANSKYMQAYILEKYGKTSKIIYPPVDVDKFTYEGDKEDYYIAVGRFAQVKKFDVLIKAFNEMSDKKLILVGDGILMNEYKRIAKKNIRFTGFLQSHEVCRLLQKAKALINIGVESFGISVVESQACGTPVLVFKHGGTGETVINGKTGFFLKEQTVRCVIEGVEKIEQTEFNYLKIRENSLQFSAENFKSQFSDFIKEVVQNEF